MIRNCSCEFNTFHQCGRVWKELLLGMARETYDSREGFAGNEQPLFSFKCQKYFSESHHRLSSFIIAHHVNGGAK